VKNHLIWVALALLMTARAFGNPAPIPEFVSNLVSRHPESAAVAARTDQIAGQQNEANAAFDPSLSQATQVRTSGYYDGLFAEQGVLQPLGSLGAEVYGKYKISDGTLPVYEQAYETLDGGEFSLGVRMPLLQDRETDARRLAVSNAAWSYLEAEARQNLLLNDLIFRGVSAWLDWYLSLSKLAVLESLVTLTKSRLSAIEQRVADGDLAAITLTEYRVTLLQRQLLAQTAQQQVAMAEQRLAYYQVPASGSVVDTGGHSNRRPMTVPAIIWPYAMPDSATKSFTTEIEQHPGLQALQAALEKAENRRRQADNEVLPELDLEMRVAQDFGSGPEYLDGTESIVGLSFSMPIGRRAARARSSIAESKVRELEYESQVLTQKIFRDVAVAKTGLANARRILEMSVTREALATQLLDQERVRFFEGVSDQFLLISREKAALEASLDRIDAELAIYRQELGLHQSLALLP